jgi:NTP pyrophosphatase (non-canonical NTP hydrolase)
MLDMSSPESFIKGLSILNNLKDLVVENSTKKGFREKLMEGLTATQIAGPIGILIRAAVMTMNEVGELAEFWESFRDGTLFSECDKAEKMRSMGLPVLTSAEEEVADSFIRTLDRAEAFNVDVAKAVAVKMLMNAGRAHLHGGKRA